MAKANVGFRTTVRVRVKVCAIVLVLGVFRDRARASANVARVSARLGFRMRVMFRARAVLCIGLGYELGLG
jgi:hypothetical protein